MGVHGLSAVLILGAVSYSSTWTGIFRDIDKQWHGGRVRTRQPHAEQAETPSAPEEDAPVSPAIQEHSKLWRPRADLTDAALVIAVQQRILEKALILATVQLTAPSRGGGVGVGAGTMVNATPADLVVATGAYERDAADLAMPGVWQASVSARSALPPIGAGMRAPAVGAPPLEPLLSEGFLPGVANELIEHIPDTPDAPLEAHNATDPAQSGVAGREPQPRAEARPSAAAAEAPSAPPVPEADSTDGLSAHDAIAHGDSSLARTQPIEIDGTALRAAASLRATAAAEREQRGEREGLVWALVAMLACTVVSVMLLAIAVLGLATVLLVEFSGAEKPRQLLRAFMRRVSFGASETPVPMPVTPVSPVSGQPGAYGPSLDARLMSFPRSPPPGGFPATPPAGFPAATTADASVSCASPTADASVGGMATPTADASVSCSTAAPTADASVGGMATPTADASVSCSTAAPTADASVGGVAAPTADASVSCSAAPTADASISCAAQTAEMSVGGNAATTADVSVSCAAPTADAGVGGASAPMVDASVGSQAKRTSDAGVGGVATLTADASVGSAPTRTSDAHVGGSATTTADASVSCGATTADAAVGGVATSTADASVGGLRARTADASVGSEGALTADASAGCSAPRTSDAAVGGTAAPSTADACVGTRSEVDPEESPLFSDPYAQPGGLEHAGLEDFSSFERPMAIHSRYTGSGSLTMSEDEEPAINTPTPRWSVGGSRRMSLEELAPQLASLRGRLREQLAEHQQRLGTPEPSARRYSFMDQLDDDALRAGWGCAGAPASASGSGKRAAAHEPDESSFSSTMPSGLRVEVNELVQVCRGLEAAAKIRTAEIRSKAAKIKRLEAELARAQGRDPNAPHHADDEGSAGPSPKAPMRQWGAWAAAGSPAAAAAKLPRSSSSPSFDKPPAFPHSAKSGRAAAPAPERPSPDRRPSRSSMPGADRSVGKLVRHHTAMLSAKGRKSLGAAGSAPRPEHGDGARSAAPAAAPARSATSPNARPAPPLRAGVPSPVTGPPPTGSRVAAAAAALSPTLPPGMRRDGSASEASPPAVPPRPLQLAPPRSPPLPPPRSPTGPHSFLPQSPARALRGKSPPPAAAAPVLPGPSSLLHSPSPVPLSASAPLGMKAAHELSAASTRGAPTPSSVPAAQSLDETLGRSPRTSVSSSTGGVRHPEPEPFVRKRISFFAAGTGVDGATTETAPGGHSQGGDPADHPRHHHHQHLHQQ